VTEKSRLGARNPKGQRDSAASGSSLADVNTFRKNARIIAIALNDIRDADQAPDVLEIDVPLEHYTIDNQVGTSNLVTQAEYLYTIAVVCLKTTRRIAGQLHKVGWGKEDEELFTRAFENLADVWSTYKRILGDLERARWGSELAPDQILAGLERPRRRYLTELDAYRVQLLVVLEYLDRAMDLTAGSEPRSQLHRSDHTL
jgi:hypothetical protein